MCDDKDIVKESKCTQEAGVVVKATWKVIKKSKIEMRVQCSNDKPREQDTFYQKPGPILI